MYTDFRVIESYPDMCQLLMSWCREATLYSILTNTLTNENLIQKNTDQSSTLSAVKASGSAVVAERPQHFALTLINWYSGLCLIVSKLQHSRNS